MTAAAKKNFGLEVTEFEHLLEQLRQGDESLFEKAFLSQFDECCQYLIKEDKASPTAAYDAAMDALLSLRTGLIRENISYGNLRFLYTRMARQHFYKATNATLPTEDVDPLLLEITTEETIDEDVYTDLTKAWAQLGADCRKLLQNLYYREQKMVSIAEAMARTPAAVRKQKQRCIAVLRNGFAKLSSQAALGR